MRKLGVFVFGMIASFAMTMSGASHVCVAFAEEEVVYVGGMTAGFTLKTGGVQIVGMCEVVTENGVESPAIRGGLKSGDYVLKINGISVDSIEKLNELIDKNREKTLEVEVKRGGELLTLRLKAVLDKTANRYKIGILARDCVSGIGTVTYIDKKTGRFGALGHAVSCENKRDIQACNAAVYTCSIVGVSKGQRGKAGELKGMFLSGKTFGYAEKVNDCGIFGKISDDFKVKDLQCAVVDSHTATPGQAFIYSTINGEESQKYEIEIVKVDKWNKENKNYVVKVTDEDLISQTGGIVQGMSGSPILQNGKLIGAITHVFVNDPTRGYGIDIQAMMRE